MNKTKPIRVEIDHSKFWTAASGQPVWMNVSVFKTLRDAGIPVDGALDLRGVLHGRLTCFNEVRTQDDKQKRFCVYEWSPGPDSVKQPVPAIIDEDDEL